MKKLTGIVSVSLLALQISHVVAQQAAGENTVVTLDDIVVTANKSGAEDVQALPTSITAFDQSELSEANLSNVEDLSRAVPGLSVSRNGQAARVYIRGIGTNLDFIGADPSVTVHVDGVYQSRPVTALDEFLDVERVEVLRGPQGTLYGRNSTGGTINVITRLPEAETDHKVAMEVGSYQLKRFMARASGAIFGSELLGSIAAMKTDRDGYVDNENPAVEDLADDDSLDTRGALRWVMNDSSQLIARFDYSDIDRSTGAYRATGKAVDGSNSPLSGLVIQPDDEFDIYTSYDEPEVDQTHWGTSFEAQLGLNEHWSINSLFAYRDLDYKTVEDTDGSNLDVLFTVIDEEQDQVSEELRLNYTSDDFDWLIGLYYLEEDHESDVAINVLGINGVNGFDTSNTTTAYALFTQGAYKISSKLTGTLGVRYSYEEKEFKNQNQLTVASNPASSFSVNEEADWDSISPKAALDYQLDLDTLIYASVSRGFKSGGFNLTSADAEFDPEYVWSYETGVKKEWLNQSLRTNISLFYYDYTDLQVSSFSTPGVVFVSNATDATIQGLELETSWIPHYSWRFDFNAAYLDATYDDYDAPLGNALVDVSDNTLNASPEYKLNMAANYYHDIDVGQLGYRLEYYWQDREYYTAFNEDVSSQGAYGLVNARINFLSLDEQLELQFYGENLINEAYSTSSREFPAATVGVTKDINPPRTFGVKLAYNFQ
jgi:iron complex outermembrane receptor protein